MPDDLGPAVAALQKKLDEQLQAVADTKRTINMLLKMDDKEALYPESENERSGSVRADQFYGKGLATSAAEYLSMRQQACQADEIFRGLKSGGFDFDLLGWQEEDRVRSLAMSLAKNTGSMGKFHRLKNGSFGLRVWYDPDFLKKAGDAPGTKNKNNKKKKKKKKAKGKAAKVATAPEAKAGKGKVTEIAAPAKPTSSAQDKSRVAADQMAQKEAAS
jgi:hypothetical protein